MTTITPTNEQNTAIQAISQWYKHGSDPFFYLAGYAGSGKTSIATIAVDSCGLSPFDVVLYASFTGKAAMTMTSKGMPATTIHNLIYKFDNDAVDPTTKMPIMQFVVDRASRLRQAKLLVLDECSMINDTVANDLISFGVKILVLGDPGQLEPVRGTGYFTKNKPHYFLTEIHRQALDNPIIRLSQDVRNGKPIPMGDFGAVTKLRFDDVDPDVLTDADQVLVGKHTTRRDLNNYILEQSGFPVGYPILPGMKVICMKNYASLGLFNGTIGHTMGIVTPVQMDQKRRYLLQQVSIYDDLSQSFKSTIPNLKMNFGAFQDHWDERNDDVKAQDQAAIIGYRHNDVFGIDSNAQVLYWDYGYAITVHKAQGSQWDDVVLFDDGMMSWDSDQRARWLYTALTRAASKITILV